MACCCRFATFKSGLAVACPWWRSKRSTFRSALAWFRAATTAPENQRCCGRSPGCCQRRRRRFASPVATWTLHAIALTCGGRLSTFTSSRIGATELAGVAESHRTVDAYSGSVDARVVGVNDQAHTTVLAADAPMVDNASFARERDRSTAGRPALQRREPGQVRKEAATATHCKCRGNGSPPYLLVIS
jgi:hypothetical protein